VIRLIWSPLILVFQNDVSFLLLISVIFLSFYRLLWYFRNLSISSWYKIKIKRTEYRTFWIARFTLHCFKSVFNKLTDNPWNFEIPLLVHVKRNEKHPALSVTSFKNRLGVSACGWFPFRICFPVLVTLEFLHSFLTLLHTLYIFVAYMTGLFLRMAVLISFKIRTISWRFLFCFSEVFRSVLGCLGHQP
jgi:hypothetical protein